MTIGITLSTDVSAFTAVATIPAGFRPKYQGWFDSSGIKFDVTVGGNVRFLDNHTAGEAFNLSAAYIIS